LTEPEKPTLIQESGTYLPCYSSVVRNFRRRGW